MYVRGLRKFAEANIVNTLTNLYYNPFFINALTNLYYNPFLIFLLQFI